MPTGKPGSFNLQTFICEYCNQPFERKVYPSSTLQYRFCNPTCRNKARIRKDTVNCPQCGKPYTPYRKGKRDGYKKYCSQECANNALCGQPSPNPAYVPKEIRAIIKELYPVTPVQIIAEQLNLSIVTIRSVAYREGVKHAPNLYYSIVHEAARTHMLLHNPGKNRPRLKIRDSWRGANWKEQREKALKRDGYHCQICNKQIGRKGHDYGVHHIKPFREFDGDYLKANQLSNLITLCRRCHVDVECGRVDCPLPLPFDQ